MKLLTFKNKFTLEQWDKLQDKKDLYAAFTPKYSHEETELREFLQTAKNFSIYYKDAEFKEVAAKLKKAAEPLLPILKDIEKHLPETVACISIGNIGYGSSKQATKDLINKLELDGRDGRGLPVLVGIIRQALSYDAEENLIKHFETGDDIPRARAAFRAYNRYLAFKENDARQLEEFKNTPEYKKQLLEIKLGLRSAINPEE